jgi:hypothetical protein
MDKTEVQVGRRKKPDLVRDLKPRKVEPFEVKVGMAQAVALPVFLERVLVKLQCRSFELTLGQRDAANDCANVQHTVQEGTCAVNPSDHRLQAHVLVVVPC